MVCSSRARRVSKISGLALGIAPFPPSLVLTSRPLLFLSVLLATVTMAGGKKKTVKPSEAMLHRMAMLEKKLGSVLGGRANHVKIQKVIHEKQHARRHGGKATGRLGLGARQSGSANRKSLPLEEDEYICEINGSVTFATTAFPINPGQPGTFPWGYRLSQLYEEYDFEDLEFYYKREVSEFATQGDAGKVILSIDYDAMDPPPTSKQQVEDTQPHKDGMPCTPEIRLRADVGLMRKNPGKYVRTGVQVANTDLRVYDAGVLYVSTQGCNNTNVIGELRVKYKVKLKVQVLNPALGSFAAVHYSAAAGASGTTQAFNAMVAQPGYTLAFSLGNSSGNSFIQVPTGSPGTYMLMYQAQNATYAFSGLPVPACSGGCTPLNFFSYNGARDATSYAISSAPNSGGYSVTVMTAFQSNGSNGTVQFNGFLSGAAFASDLWVFQIPTNILTGPVPRSNLYDVMSRRIATLEALLPEARPVVDARDVVVTVPPPPPMLRQDSSSSSGLSSKQLEAMYRQLTMLGVIPEDDSPVAVAGDDGIVRISHSDTIRPMGVSTSAPPPSAGLRKFLGLP